MNFPSLKHDGDRIELIEGKPASFDGFLLAADTVHAVAGYGRLIIQQFKLEDKWIRYYVLQPDVRIQITINNEEGFLTLFINLKKDIKLLIAGHSKIQLAFSKYWLSYSGNQQVFELRAGKEYEFMEIGYSKDGLKQFENAFPFLHDLTPSARWMMPDTMKIVNEIVCNGFNNDEQPLFYDISIVQILFVLLNRFGTMPGLSPAEIEATNKARKLIEEQTKNFPNITAIAYEVGLSEYKLKINFKLLYGKTVFDVYKKAKLEKAYIQVTRTNEPIKAIAIEAGYKWSPNFATAFKTQFGESPELLRRKLRNDK